MSIIRIFLIFFTALAIMFNVGSAYAKEQKTAQTCDIQRTTKLTLTYKNVAVANEGLLKQMINERVEQINAQAQIAGVKTLKQQEHEITTQDNLNFNLKLNYTVNDNQELVEEFAKKVGADDIKITIHVKLNGECH